MRQLPLHARAFVAATIVAGTVVFVLLAPQIRFDRPVLFLGLLLLS